VVEKPRVLETQHTLGAGSWVLLGQAPSRRSASATTASVSTSTCEAASARGPASRESAIGAGLEPGDEEEVDHFDGSVRQTHTDRSSRGIHGQKLGMFDG